MWNARVCSSRDLTRRRLWWVCGLFQLRSCPLCHVNILISAIDNHALHWLALQQERRLEEITHRRSSEKIRKRRWNSWRSTGRISPLNVNTSVIDCKLIFLILARELCFRLLDPKPRRRLKGEEILKHGWFLKQLTEDALKEKPSQQ